MAKFKSFMSNLWFYHKWHILVGVLVLLTLGVATVQCATKEEPDVNILFIGDRDPGDRDVINEELKQYYEDANGDGKKVLSLAFMGITDEQTMGRLQTEVVAGDHVIYILDPDYYQKLLKYNVLAPLQEVLGFVPEGALDKYGVPIKYLDLYTLEGFNKMPMNSVLCIRGTNGDAVNYKESSDGYKNNIKLFTKLVNYKNDKLIHTQINLGKITANTVTQSCIYSMEESVYYVARLNDADMMPYLSFEEYGLHTAEGKPVFGDNEKEKALELAKGNKILLLDETVYTYLAENGALKDISGIYKGNGGEQFGVLLNGKEPGENGEKYLAMSGLVGFCYIDTAKNPTVYVCATADIEGDNATVFEYLLNYKY